MKDGFIVQRAFKQARKRIVHTTLKLVVLLENPALGTAFCLSTLMLPDELVPDLGIC